MKNEQKMNGSVERNIRLSGCISGCGGDHVQKISRRYKILALILFIIVAGYFIFPFGLFPLPGMPNCGPEHWGLLGQRFDSKADVIAYFKAHKLELISGQSLPRLDGNPSAGQVGPLDMEIDWQALENDIRVEHRLFYNIYILRYTHTGCGGGPSYTFKVTSFGWASLFGCCGI